MQIGIVGKPSSGKSSFFAAATLAQVEISSRPFTTIKPNIAIGFVRTDCVEKFFNVKCNPRQGYCLHGTRFVPVELMDVAGLVPDAHLGKGLGLSFLDDLRKADALIHVVDASGSTNERGEMVEDGTHDPVQDVLFLEKEILYWFLGVVEKNFNKIAKQPIGSKQKMIEMLSQALSGLSIKQTHVEKTIQQIGVGEKMLRDWSEEDKKKFAEVLLKTSKPMIIAANKCDLPSAEKNIGRMKKEFPQLKIIPCSAVAELSLKKASKENLLDYVPGTNEFKILDEGKLNEKQKQGLEFMQKNVLEKFGNTGIQQVLECAAFELLGLMPIFPGGVNKLEDKDGNVLPDCFLLPPHSTALDFAFALHTDMGEGFIKAIDVKKKLPVGRDHELKAGDVIEIAFKKK